MPLFLVYCPPYLTKGKKMVNEILNQLNSIIKANEEKIDGQEMYGSILSVIEYIHHHKDK